MKLHEIFSPEETQQPDFSAYKKNLEIMLAHPSAALYRGQRGYVKHYGDLSYIENTGRTGERDATGKI